MTANRPPLSYDVFVAPSKPFAAPPPQFGDPQAWDPVTSTLIFGARDAVLVDTLETVPEATALADWIALHQRRLTTIYITHGHSDHFLGLPVLLDRFPDARAVGGMEPRRSTGGRLSAPPRSSPVTRIRPAAIRPRSWPSPAATSNTTGSSATQACPTRNCSTPWSAAIPTGSAASSS